ncbi:unnamed protein product [Arctogadus glacialis]
MSCEAVHRVADARSGAFVVRCPRGLGGGDVPWLFEEKKQKNASGDEHLVAAAPTYRLSYVILRVLRTEPSDGELHPGTGEPTDVSLEGSRVLGNLQTSLWRAPGTGEPTDVSLEGSRVLGNLQTSLWRAPGTGEPTDVSLEELKGAAAHAFIIIRVALQNLTGKLYQ